MEFKVILLVNSKAVQYTVEITGTKKALQKNV